MQNVEILSSQIRIRHSRISCNIYLVIRVRKGFPTYFESTGGTIDTVVMKNIFPLQYEIHY